MVRLGARLKPFATIPSHQLAMMPGSRLLEVEVEMVPMFNVSYNRRGCPTSLGKHSLDTPRHTALLPIHGVSAGFTRTP
jgi:hypothetical protein